MMNKYTDTYILEAFLDPEGNFYDYGTDFIRGDNVVDLKRTGISFYDQFFDTKDSKYLQDVKNLQGTVVKMTPEDYYRKCSEDIFKVPVSKLKYERGEIDRRIIDRLKVVMTKYNRRMCMPMINYADNGQEGLHRMMAIAELYGWDHEVPVLVVDWYDKQRAHEDAETAKVNRVENTIKKSVKNAQKYKYRNYEEFQEQLQFCLDQEFEYSNDLTPPIHFNLVDIDEEQFEVQIGPASVTVWKEDIQLKPQETEEDIVDDIDEEDIDEFLLKYLGPDFETEFPDVRKKLLKTESLDTNIRSIVEKGWSKETCHPAYVDKWNFSNRAAGQCAVTAMYINQKYGYDIYETMVGRSRHFFNITSDGKVIDATCDQFPVEPVNYSASRKREFKDLYRSCGDRYELFVKNLENRQLNESVENIDRQTVVDALEDANHSYYMNTSMICEIICENLYYNHNIDARYRGRTIYVGTDKIATIDVSKDGPNLVGMIGYKLLI